MYMITYPGVTRVVVQRAGVITTLVTPEHESTLLKMAEELKITMHKAPEPAVEPLALSDLDAETVPEAADVEKTKQGLEDIFNLY